MQLFEYDKKTRRWQANEHAIRRQTNMAGNNKTTIQNELLKGFKDSRGRSIGFTDEEGTNIVGGCDEYTELVEKSGKRIFMANTPRSR